MRSRKQFGFLRSIRFITLFSAFWGFGLESSFAQQYSIEEAIEYAHSNQNVVKSAMLKVAEADQKILETRAQGLPHLNAVFGNNYFIKKPIVLLPESFGMGNPNFERSVSFAQNHNIAGTVTASSLLFNWTYLQGLKAARIYKNYAELDYKSIRRKVEDEVTNAYLPALLIGESEKMILKNLANLKALQKETKELFKEGFAEALDVDRLDLSIANLAVQLDNLGRNKQMALEFLKFKMGYPMEKEINITSTTDEVLKSIPDELLAEQVSFLSHPAYRTILATERLNEVNVKVQESAYYPSLTGFVNYQMQWQGDKLNDLFYTPTSTAGFQLSIPIFSGFGTKSKVQQAKLQLQRLQYGKNDMERAMDFQVRNARINYKNAIENLAQRKKNVQLAQKIYETTKIKYKEGVGSSIEINQAEMSLYQTQQNVIEGKFDLLKAKISLKQALGK